MTVNKMINSACEKIIAHRFVFLQISGNDQIKIIYFSTSDTDIAFDRFIAIKRS